MYGKLLLLCGLICLGIIINVSILKTLPTDPSTTITDISWPNCDVALASSYTGIVGVNGGLDFHSNHCLYSESRLFSTYALYLNTGYPGPSYGEKFSNSPLKCSVTDELCLAYNYGYNAALYSITYADLQSVHTFIWWLDVETSNSWTSNSLQNRAALIGMIDALNKYTFLPTIGFYSYPEQWDSITGYWVNNYPDWIATGTGSLKIAISSCKKVNFTGGSNWLAQYTIDLDHNYICNGSFMQHLKL
jgi:hypothetical protein